MISTPPHPLQRLFDDWLPECDFGVMYHGFLDHGRDYELEIELGIGANPGRYVLHFTHVTALSYKTRVASGIWPESWDDRFINYDSWIEAGEPEGYVWGNNWSLAYPGISVVEQSSLADSWTKKIGKQFFEATLETDRFVLSLVFHDIRTKKISDKSDTVSRAIIPLE